MNKDELIATIDGLLVAKVNTPTHSLTAVKQLTDLAKGLRLRFSNLLAAAGRYIDAVDAVEEHKDECEDWNDCVAFEDLVVERFSAETALRTLLVQEDKKKKGATQS